MKKLYRITLAALMFFALITCLSGCLMLEPSVKTEPSSAPAAQEKGEVVSVTVSPAQVTVVRDTRRQFTANVTVTGSAPKTVTWEVSGNTSSQTNISPDGTLYVGRDEKSDARLVIKATSTFDKTKSGTARVII